MRLFVFLLAAAAVASAGPALAQDEPASDEADIVGFWSFSAETYEQCSFRGEAMISAGPSDELYLCELTATDSCADAWSYTAEQTCVATREGDLLSIKSRITSVEPPTDLYLPDDFLLRIIDGSLMEGELHSSGTTRARFVRTNGPIS